MNTMELLAWARGPGLSLSLIVLLLGVTVRLTEMLLLGRKTDLSEPREAHSGLYGWRTVITRSLPSSCVTLKRLAFIAGYAFHIGLFLIVFFYVPHILLIKALTGLEWPGLPPWLIDGVTLITLAAMLLVLWYRVADPVRRYISRFNDYYSLAITFLPVITGYLAYHRLLLSYNEMLVIHILSVELLLASFPFTKLMHAFTLVFSRWYNGQMAGRKGVKV
ncbi:MAG: hypothetical protein LJE74_05440 [Proteobacteria bacterium]|jgi:nitrate reductase gamma subunit|nr:hypothetical protein [Pseudomonadota bacterium]